MPVRSIAGKTGLSGERPQLSRFGSGERKRFSENTLSDKESAFPAVDKQKYAFNTEKRTLSRRSSRIRLLSWETYLLSTRARVRGLVADGRGPLASSSLSSLLFFSLLFLPPPFWTQ